MKFENELNCATLRNTLIEWCMGCDGKEGATEDVLDKIPWSDEIEKILPWDKVYRSIDEAIGVRLKVTCETITNSYKREDFLKAIDKKVENIVKVYDEIIDELNKKNCYCMVVEKFRDVDVNGFCRYDLVGKVYGDSVYGCICEVWDKYVTPFTWDFKQFVDACFNGSVNIEDNIYCHIGDKVTNARS